MFKLVQISIEITEYADDTTVFVKGIWSFPRLFDLLQQFENWSGSPKSEILWEGSLGERKDAIRNPGLKLSDEPIEA